MNPLLLSNNMLSGHGASSLHTDFPAVFRRRRIAERALKHVSIYETHWHCIYDEDVSIVP